MRALDIVAPVADHDGLGLIRHARIPQRARDDLGLVLVRSIEAAAVHAGKILRQAGMVEHDPCKRLRLGCGQQHLLAGRVQRGEHLGHAVVQRIPKYPLLTVVRTVIPVDRLVGLLRRKAIELHERFGDRRADEPKQVLLLRLDAILPQRIRRRGCDARRGFRQRSIQIKQHIAIALFHPSLPLFMLPPPL